MKVKLGGIVVRVASTRPRGVWFWPFVVVAVVAALFLAGSAWRLFLPVP